MPRQAEHQHLRLHQVHLQPHLQGGHLEFLSHLLVYRGCRLFQGCHLECLAYLECLACHQCNQLQRLEGSQRQPPQESPQYQGCHQECKSQACLKSQECHPCKFQACHRCCF